METRLNLRPAASVVFVLLAVCTAGQAAQLQVPSTQYPTIEAAITAAQNGDTVIVADGLHTGEGNKNIDFQGKAITVRSENGPENCTIDCEGSGRGFKFDSDEKEDSVLDGFTIINGGYRNGGAIHCRNSSPTIINCVIRDCAAGSLGGGAIHCRNSTPTITNCVITGCAAYGLGGGGIHCYGSAPAISNCIITGNKVRRYGRGGGGIYYSGCAYDGDRPIIPTITNCTISGNSSAPYNGGGIYCRDPGLVISNSDISGNSAGYNGGGIYCQWWGGLTIDNCSLVGNSAANEGGGMYAVGVEQVRMTNCVLWANTDSSGTGVSAQMGPWEMQSPDAAPPVIFSCIQDDDPGDGDVAFGTESHNIDEDPEFVRNPDDGGDGWGDDPETPEIDEGANDDFGDLHLQRSSPCIDTGVPNFSADSGTLDMDGQPRLIGLRVDMGADEYAPVLIVTQPQDGESWTSGSTQEINWTGCCLDAVDILLSKDGGGSWEGIETGTDNTGTYLWELPGKIDCNQCVISVVPSVADANAICVESGVFAIVDLPNRPAGPPGQMAGREDLGRAGLSEKSGPGSPCVKWQFETEGSISAPVVVGHNNKIYVACEDGKLYKLGRDGALLWSFDANTPLTAAPAVGYYDRVYAGGKNGRLYAIDNQGSLQWTYDTGAAVHSAPTVSPDGKIYLCSQDGVLYALAADGGRSWSFETAGFEGRAGANVASPSIAADGTVYIGGLYDPNLYALNPGDGSIKWACNFKPTPDPCHVVYSDRRDWFFASPVVGADGTIYQSLLYDPNLYAVEPEGGAISWLTNLADPCSTWFDPNYIDEYCSRYEYTDQDVQHYYYYSNADGWSKPALGPDGTIYVSFDDAYLRAVNPDGTIKWVTKLGQVGGFTLTVGSDGLIYAAGDDGQLYIVNRQGEQTGQLATEGWLNYPVISAKNMVIVGDSRDDTMFVTDVNNVVLAIGDCGQTGSGGKSSNKRR